MTHVEVVGQSTGGKAVNLGQLQRELESAGMDCGAGLGMMEDTVYTYASDGTPADFLEAQQAAVDTVIAAHVAMRDKTDQEYAEEFQNPETAPARKQEIRDITAGLLPREQVPITQEEWDAKMNVPA